jgi:hypothetical protein
MFNTAGNHVFRYNTALSDEDHYYNDIFGGCSNFSAVGFPNRDSDIYGNWLGNCWDDAIEAEGANCNVRIWGNYTTHHLVSIATAGTHVGPVYLWRNVSDAARRAPEGLRQDVVDGPFLKAGANRGFGGGRAYLFHNTFLQGNGGVSTGFSSNGGPLMNHVSRNNILHVKNEERSSIAEKQDGSWGNDFDYDLYNGRITNVSGTHEQHGIRGVPVYAADNDPGVYALDTASPGYDAGLRLPNFNDGYVGAAPDIGAQEAGASPLEFGVDAYR